MHEKKLSGGLILMRLEKTIFPVKCIRGAKGWCFPSSHGSLSPFYGPAGEQVGVESKSVVIIFL